MKLLDIPGPNDKVVHYGKMEIIALDFSHPQVVLSRTYNRNGDINYYIRKGGTIVWQKTVKAPEGYWETFEEIVNSKP